MHKSGLKPVLMSVAAIALFTAVATLLPLPGREAVDLDIVPSETAKFLEAVKENGEFAVKEPGCREFNVTVLANNPNHVFLYEVYENEAALTAHRAGEHFKKFQAATANMVTGRNVRAMSLVAFNSKGH